MLFNCGQEEPWSGKHQSPASAFFWRLAAREGNIASALHRKWLRRLLASASGRPCTPAPALLKKASSILLIDTRSALKMYELIWKMQVSTHVMMLVLKANQTMDRIVTLDAHYGKRWTLLSRGTWPSERADIC